MGDGYTDSQLDQQLRNVPIPDGLLADLRRVRDQSPASWTDRQLDDALRNVAVPEVLGPRLREIPDDVLLDEQLRDVEPPWTLNAQIRIGERRRRRPRLSRLAAAAMIFVALSAAYLLGMGALLFEIHGSPSRVTYLDVEYDGPLDIDASPLPPLQFAVQREDPPSSAPAPPQAYVQVDPPDASRWPLAGPAGQLIQEIERGAPLEEDIFLVSYGRLGFPRRSEERLPRFEEPPPPPQGAIEPPLVRAFNRRFLLKYGVNPPVFPALDASLTRSIAPLSTATGSYDLSASRLAESRLPSRREVVVEDFLAASTASDPGGARGSLQLVAQGAPSVFGAGRARSVVKDLGWRPGPAHLLQVSVESGALAHRKRPQQITIALDVSASMRWDGRLDVARMGIRRLVSQLGPRDRVSIVAFNERIRRRIDGIGRDSRDELVQFLDSLQADGGTNLPRALQTSLSATMQSSVELEASGLLLLITDGRAPMAQQTLERLGEMFRVAATQDVRFFLLELNEPYDADPDLERLCRTLRGDKRTVVNSQSACRAILGGYLHGDTIVARDAVLSVRFNPQVVTAYRLIGHTAASAAGLAPRSPEANLHVGETATCLYEVWLQPGAEGKVAEAEIRWHDVAAGRRQVRSRSIGVEQFGIAFESAPPALQAAALAAETAEVLSGSPFADSRNRSLAHIRNVAGRLSLESSRHDGLKKMVQFVERAEQVRSGRLGRGEP